ncbi:unnamed protein product, partial [Mesorhabditis belari]|uniref:DNA polymerase delta subunit 2 n=1 Tax=Mesorhabditis belari TaxID=2138241 RepID=A0AAF3F282_9BILA
MDSQHVNGSACKTIKVMVSERRVKRSALSYENRSERFLIGAADMGSGWHQRQYFHLYEARVKAVRERILQNAQRMLSKNIKISSLENVAEEVDSQSTTATDVLVVGTIEKRIRARPSVLKTMADDDLKMDDSEEDGGNGIDSEVPTLIGNKDFLEFEDDKQILTGNINMDSVATGCTCGLFGRQVSGGVFEVKQVVWPMPAPQRPLPTFDSEPMIAFLSGINVCGNPQQDANALSGLTLFTQWAGGQMGIETDKAAHVCRVVITGESINVASQAVEFANKAAYLIRHEEAPNVGCAKVLDEHIARLTTLMPVDLMPGDGDPTVALHPQRPIHKTVLPMAGLNGGTLNLTTNPYEFSLGELDFCVLSGQTITDLRRLSTINSASKLMTHMLTWQHLAPTCPDTVDGFPLIDRDPFVIERFPHVMVVGNQPKAEVDVFESAGRRCVLISLPRFSRSQIVALLNLRTLKVEWKQFTV